MYQEAAVSRAMIQTAGLVIVVDKPKQEIHPYTVKNK